ncbi:hypothetical protein PIB30_024857 [Stylosanthes scabra]|uniref:Uncharacterized protein n=1 Tax=Stylosanthes scabra TaxID=79078 RepID=A0ABU6ZA78_9FABA|nr:hypothetical protein [Stylosanthes scabra]
MSSVELRQQQVATQLDGFSQALSTSSSLIRLSGFGLGLLESGLSNGLARPDPLPKVAILKSHPAPLNGKLAGWRAKPA